MDLQDAGTAAKFMIRDRDSRFTVPFDAVLQSDGIKLIKSGVCIPRMKSIME
jgi:hypothetical protein